MRRRRITILCVAGATLATLVLVAHASPRYRRAFLAQYPATEGTKLAECQTCHLGNPPALNAYGVAFRAAHYQFADLEKADSDKDGASNLAEIKALTYPGDPTDKPGVKRRGSPPDTATVHAGAKPDSTANARAKAASDSTAVSDSTARSPAMPDSAKTKR